MQALTPDDFVRILGDTDASLVRQYQALLATEGVTLEFAADGIRRLADIAFEVNERTENIGARRLHTVMERLLEQVSFDADARAGESVVIDAAFVDTRLAEVARRDDLARYIL
jgi:ATP-dependent HslUV protease ATP-binding subunit HslU